MTQETDPQARAALEGTPGPVATLGRGIPAASQGVNPAPTKALQALELIAAPKRPDGTWNRDREACRRLAADALAAQPEQQWPTPPSEPERPEPVAFDEAACRSNCAICGDDWPCARERANALRPYPTSSDATPPAPQPLTLSDEQIASIERDCYVNGALPFETRNRFARAILAAAQEPKP